MTKIATKNPPPKTQDLKSDSDSNKADLQSDGEDLHSDDDSGDERVESIDFAEDGLNTTRSGKRRRPKALSSTHDSTTTTTTTAADQAMESSRKKSKLDSLWADFNAPLDKSTSRAELLATEAAAAAITRGFGLGGSKLASESKMVTITTTYDFAGETVTVTKDVPENSKEAMNALKKTKKTGEKSQSLAARTAGALAAPTTTTTTTTLSSSSSSPPPPPPPPESPPESSSLSPSAATTPATPSTPIQDSTLSTTLDPITEEVSTPSSSSITVSTTISNITTSATTSPTSTSTDPSMGKEPIRYVRRKSPLDELATIYGVKKPPKLNTLEKSKLDWKTFVGKEGIEDELKHHNKDGYMEKVAFLQRTDEHRDKEYQRLKKRK
ncbi:Craniofacial development protein 1 [Modicella reniformis]|uniref:SWR1-complex protein 5 n=1 Tax=Modicella reniformis TaxID=1440133 RepID=A0A9P6INX3_9FUNG|nr:Craniofacial development protein 1 [Modicella reniformis]